LTSIAWTSKWAPWVISSSLIPPSIRRVITSWNRLIVWSLVRVVDQLGPGATRAPFQRICIHCFRPSARAPERRPHRLGISFLDRGRERKKHVFATVGVQSPAVGRAFYWVVNERLQPRIPVRAIEEDALAAMNGYSWPGNVHELSNAIEGALPSPGSRLSGCKTAGWCGREPTRTLFAEFGWLFATSRIQRDWLFCRSLAPGSTPNIPIHRLNDSANPARKDLY
jgi:hypothetical protein